MLSKVKVVMVLGLVLGVVRAFFPELDLGEDFQTAAESLVNALFVLIPIGAGWFSKESQDQIDKLVPK